MSWNRRNLKAGVLYVALIVVSMAPSLANAEDKAGNFTLSQPVHWGGVVLAPGDYTCAVDNKGPSKVIFVRGAGGKPSYLFPALSVSETAYSPDSHLALAVRGGERFVGALILGEKGETVYFPVPEEKVQEAQVHAAVKSASTQ